MNPRTTVIPRVAKKYTAITVEDDTVVATGGAPEPHILHHPSLIIEKHMVRTEGIEGEEIQ